MSTLTYFQETFNLEMPLYSIAAHYELKQTSWVKLTFRKWKKKKKNTKKVMSNTNKANENKVVNWRLVEDCVHGVFLSITQSIHET